MNTKPVMAISAIVLLALGITFQFFPNEVLQQFGVAPMPMTALIGQLTGALYIGFAVMNWMAKGVSIGGIYARPLAIGNLAHFLVGGLALLKYALATEGSFLVWTMTGVYLVLAGLFGTIFMTNPRTAR